MLTQFWSKLVYEFWYDYGKKYIFIETLKRCWNKVWYLLNKHELDTPFLKGKNAQVIGLMKDELGEKKKDKICWIKRKNLVT